MTDSPVDTPSVGNTSTDLTLPRMDDAADAGDDISDLMASLRGARQMSTFHRLAVGMMLPFKAAGILWNHRRTWPMVVLPALINAAVFVLLAIFMVTYAGDIIGWVWSKPTGLIALIFWWAAIVFASALSLVASYAFTLILAGIVASPFNDVLSARVEREALAGEMPEPDYGLIWGSLRAVGSSIVILLSYGIVMLPILVLNLVPVVGQVAASILSTGVSAMFIALEFTDYSLERRGLNLRQKFELLEDNRTFALGFGLGTAVLIWVPLLNFLTIPIAVAGGTLLGIILTEPAPSIASDTPVERHG